jgi:hypothetical protein
MRLKGFSRASDNALPYFQSVTGVDFDGEGKVFLIRHFDHSRYPDKIDLRRKIESANNGRPGEDEDIYVRSSELAGNGQGPANVT